MSLRKILSHHDAYSLLELIQDSISCNETQNVINLMNKLKDLLPYDHGVCLLIHKKDINKITSFSLTNISYPEKWLELYHSNKLYQADPIFKENFINFKLQNWSDTYKIRKPSKDFVNLSHDFGLTNCLRHSKCYNIICQNQNSGVFIVILAISRIDFC